MISVMKQETRLRCCNWEQPKCSALARSRCCELRAAQLALGRATNYSSCLEAYFVPALLFLGLFHCLVGCLSQGSSLSALFLLERNCLLHAACAVRIP